MMIEALFRPISARLAVVVSFVIGIVYGVVLFGPGFALGTSEYWQLPEGLIGTLPDTGMSMSGYFWFVQDAWRWPLFHVVKADAPEGVNIALTDPVAVLALLGKVARTLTGTTFNLFPLWLVGAFGLTSAALAAFVRGLGERSLLAAVVAGLFGSMAPVLHFRFGHLGLAAAWTFLFALAVYAGWKAAGERGLWRPAAAMFVLCLLAFASSIYLYVMTAAVAAAFFVQAVADRRTGLLGGVAGLLGVLGTGVASLWIYGLLGNSDLSRVTVPFGVASMNLVAPFWPQSSGAFAWTGLYALTRGSIGATRGQYEGFCYLGLGALLFLGIAVVRRGWMLPGLVRRNWALALVFVVLTLWAISNQVYLGPVLLFSVPLPDLLLNTVLAWFRASARMFWPVVWTMLALGIAGTLASLRPRTLLMVASIAVVLQWIDLSVLRRATREVVRGPAPSAFGTAADAAALEREIGRRGRVVVVPSIYCTVSGPGEYKARDTLAAAEAQLMAGRSNAEMPGIVLGRGQTDCAAERATALPILVGQGVLIALAQPDERDRTAEARERLACRPVPVGVVCTAP